MTMLRLAIPLVLLTKVFCQESTLQQVHIVFRHGDRWPVNLYPTDPNEGIVWPNGPGQLTNVGKQQQYELGTFLRNRYDGFLSTDPRELLVRSSDKDRCIASTQVNLAAFYKPRGQWVWDNSIDWQPVPIHTVPGKEDGLLNEDASCPEGHAATEEAKNSKISQNYNNKYKSIFAKVSKLSGMTVNDPMSVLDLYGTLFIEKLKNLKIPDWVTFDLWSELERAANEAFTVNFKSDKVRRLRAGPLITEIMTKMQNKVKGQEVSQKAFIYSTHDAIVAAVLNAMNVFNGVTVPYCATILTELHKIDGSNVVRTFYRNGTDVYPLILPGCASDCPLDTFAQKMSYVTISYPDQWKQECGLTDAARACGFSANSSGTLAPLGHLQIISLLATLIVCKLAISRS